MATQDTPRSYGSVSRFNHWLGAVLVLALLGIGLYFEDLPKGDARKFWRGLHVAIGAFASLFFLFRVWWRVRSVSPLALPQKPALQMFSRVVHLLLLAGIATLAITGPLTIWSNGRAIEVFSLLSIPSPFPEFRALHGPVKEIHVFVANAMIWLIGLHLLGVVKHQFVDRDNILSRMAGSRSGS